MALNDNIKNRLKTAAEADIDRYINGLKLSDADKQGVKTAYGNMLNGILDGSITLDGRTFNDEQGRYKNLTDGTDTYGLAANYLYRYRSLLNEDSQSKKDSKDSSKSTSRFTDLKKLSKALTQALFYGDTFDSNAFVGLDSQSYDPNTKKMSNSARLGYTLSAA